MGCKMLIGMVASGFMLFFYNFTELSSEPEFKMLGYHETFLAK
jgi:hypothetical protein